MLTYEEVNRFYDAFGSKQDKQFYEEPAIRDLLAYGDFGNAKSVVEFGCGTGKLASRLLHYYLPKDSHYLGFDISRTMVELCRKNIAQFAERANCIKSEGSPYLDVAAQSADRFVSTYVLDLLSEADIAAVLDNAHRVLQPGGYLCLAGLTHGANLVSNVVEYFWMKLFKLNPNIVGGCRPIQLLMHVQNDQWRIIHNSVMVSWGIPSEVIVARKN